MRGDDLKGNRIKKIEKKHTLVRLRFNVSAFKGTFFQVLVSVRFTFVREKCVSDKIGSNTYKKIHLNSKIKNLFRVTATLLFTRKWEWGCFLIYLIFHLLILFKILSFILNSKL